MSAFTSNCTAVIKFVNFIVLCISFTLLLSMVFIECPGMRAHKHLIVAVCCRRRSVSAVLQGKSACHSTTPM